MRLAENAEVKGAMPESSDSADSRTEVSKEKRALRSLTKPFAIRILSCWASLSIALRARSITSSGASEMVSDNAGRGISSDSPFP